MAKLSIRYDDGFGEITAKTTTSFYNPREDYADDSNEPCWPSLLSEFVKFIECCGFKFDRISNDKITEILEGDYINDEFKSDEPTDEDTCAGREYNECEMNESHDVMNSDEKTEQVDVPLEVLDESEPMEACNKEPREKDEKIDNWLNNLDEKCTDTFLKMCGRSKKS